MKRERVTVTLREDLLRKIDERIDGVTTRNRSHAMEMLLNEYFARNKIKKAIILAGGLGTRLRPLTLGIPKPLVPIKGKPLLEHTIDLLKDAGIDEIILSVGYKGHMIEDHFGDGTDYGLDITYIHEETPLGTAGPVKKARKKLDEPFFVVNGDIMVRIDLVDMADFHMERGGLATIALTPVENISRYGVVEMKGFRIQEFVEKPPRNEPGLINAGIYALEPEIIDYIPDGKVSMEKEIFPILVKEGKMFGYPFHGKWFDTGTFESLEKAKRNF